MNELGALLCLPGLLLLGWRDDTTLAQMAFVSALVWGLILAVVFA